MKNTATLLATSLIKFYTYFISPLLPRSCRFFPSCSEYSLQALERYGLLRGLLLSLKRVLRCNPFYRGGYDPVDKGEALRG